MVRSLWAGLRDGSLLLATLMSLQRIAVGFVISVVVGSVLGAFTASDDWAKDTLGRLLTALQTIPSIAWLPLAILWFGLNDRAVIFVVVIGSTLPIAISVESGIRNVPVTLMRVARMMRLTPWQMTTKVILPASVPALVAGLRNAWAFAWRSLMAGELLIASTGLGQVLSVARELVDMGRVFAVLLIIGLLGYAVDQGIFRRLEDQVARKWDVAPR